jgi:hypothetical protein
MSFYVNLDQVKLGKCILNQVWFGLFSLKQVMSVYLKIVDVSTD